MKIARVLFTVELLEALLPKGSKLLSVRECADRGIVEAIVSHDSFEEVKVCELVPIRTVVAEKEYRVTKVSYGA